MLFNSYIFMLFFPQLVAGPIKRSKNYCDFNGYSTIAIGAAKITGINLMENFDTLYLSRTIKEFWRKWHISLSIWLNVKKYVDFYKNI